MRYGLIGKPANKQCERCGAFNNVCWEDSRTMYETTPLDTCDPNAPKALCRICAKEHHDYWDDMWSEYWANIY